MGAETKHLGSATVCVPPYGSRMAQLNGHFVTFIGYGATLARICGGLATSELLRYSKLDQLSNRKIPANCASCMKADDLRAASEARWCTLCFN